uniref:Uncharacterized protein n=1 Tax=Chromera velia CCMP2878 TaxID=1169474 RepID=A0A0G4HRZ4_9ALVE|mmetsp:Transcript_16325/g.33163  ORF Transcript_16325/g.33163 Transcript_16325/m.33163 type:complete len:284 (+) Transcript_16325:152-1003(+)|eukprot:Cvel_8142.t1-p1 / transcript=Cvel_8142.t1 / gene=Cvel_8142 / organism=Chromera_velia_CCMP2878 / gene_product=hypothetical protein / transcript_product=hypothetical protein / location=Cvel_scaffold443:23656-25536(-) / protein_length=283 / sequence_SO=supercontig / SO=protein_coding / is_pseudo=false
MPRLAKKDRFFREVAKSIKWDELMAEPEEDREVVRQPEAVAKEVARDEAVDVASLSTEDAPQPMQQEAEAPVGEKEAQQQPTEPVAPTGSPRRESSTLSRRVSIQDPPATVMHFKPTPFEEAQGLAKALCGSWITLVKRSDLYEPVLKKMGISFIKRKVLNSYAIQIDGSMRSADVYYIVAHMPMGVQKTMVWNIAGEQVLIEDSDAGNWMSFCRVVDFSQGGHSGRALQNVRTGKAGKVEETRRIIPDAEHGQLLHIHIQMWPTGEENKPVVVNRYCKRLDK